MTERASTGTNGDLTLAQRVDALLDECRHRGGSAGREEIERLYTDGCAEVLALEAKQRGLKRRLLSARSEGSEPGDALRRRFEELTADVTEARRQLRQLRAALEWVQTGRDIQQERFARSRSDDEPAAATQDRS